MKTLETVQKIMNAGKIISKIVQICSLVAGIISLVGVLSLVFIPDSFKLGGITIHSMIENSKELNNSSVYYSLIVAIIFCIAYWFLGKTANKYFQNEIMAGTPFTFEGAKELQTLGLYTICIPLIADFAKQIVYQIMNRTIGGITDTPINGYSSVFMGLLVVIIGLLCKYGAEILNNKDETNENISV